MSNPLQEKYNMIYPEKREIDLEEYLSLTDLSRQTDSRPHAALAMAASLDGRAAWRGRADELRSSKDEALFRALRSLADACVIGEHTIKAEGYKPLIRDIRITDRRLGRGQTAQPLAVVVSKDFNIDWEAPLFADGDSSVLVWTEKRNVPPDTEAVVEVLHEPGMSFASLWQHLWDRGCKLVLCEGGPTLHASLERENLLQDIFLALEPEFLGKKNIPWVEGDFPEPKQLELQEVLQDGSELFLHYRTDHEEELVAAPA